MSMESRSTKSRRRKPPDVFPHLLTRAHARENPGLVLAINIKHAVELIDANPVGFKLPADTR